MNRYRLMKAGIQVNEGIERFNGKKDVYEELLYSFPEDTNYSKMVSALEEGNAKEAFAAAHSLKGVTANLSMNRMYEALIPLVEELRKGALPETDDLLSPVADSYQEILQAIMEGRGSSE